MFQHICAWCGVELAPPEDDGKQENSISHGVCEKCYIKMVAELSKSLDDFLDKIKKPVFIVGGDGRVISANQLGKEMVDKEMGDIRGYLGGDVFECKYAKLPGGCGKTLHCKNCTIRNTVMKTLSTGKDQYNVPCYLNHSSDQKINLLVSTEKKGDTVLLRIDEVSNNQEEE